MLKSINERHAKPRYFKTGETVEPQSTDPDDPSSRLDATDSAVKIYKAETPGQTKETTGQSKETTGQTIKRVFLDKTERKNK